MQVAYDFQTAVSQSAADKVIDSVKYPFTVIDRKTPYEHLARFSEEAGDEEATAEVGKEQIHALLKEVGKIRSSGRSYARTSVSMEEQDLALEMSGALNTIAANASECLAAQGAVERHNQQNPNDKLQWDGPAAEELKSIIEAASEVQPSFERLSAAMGDWGIKALVTWLKVATKRPRFALGGRSFDLGVDPIIDGTGKRG